jgi:hypothetical protein
MRKVPKSTLGQGDEPATPFSLNPWYEAGTADVGVVIVVEAAETVVRRLARQKLAII